MNFKISSGFISKTYLLLYHEPYGDTSGDYSDYKSLIEESSLMSE